MMKLIKCNVRNFGTLQNFSLEFSNSLTIIKEDNGFGKSTLAAFIKAMLYGLSRTTKRSIDENEFKKFKPWQGGVFGGSLDIEVNGKQYRVERTFGSKDKDDTFRLLDLASGTESDDFSSDLGVELFGVDAESFERSVLVKQIDTAAKMNNDIRAKLTGLIENSDDISNYDNAVKVLEKRAKFYSVSNGARGDIADKTREIESLQASLTDKSAAVSNLDGINRELSELKAKSVELTQKKDDLRKRITTVSDAAALIEQKRQRNELTLALQERRKTIDGIKQCYPNGFPTEAELLEAGREIELVKAVETELSVIQSNGDDKQELENLKGFFENGIPTEQEIYDTRKNISTLSQLEIKAEGLKTQLSDAPQSAKNQGNASFKLCIVLAVVLGALGAAALLWQTAIGIAVLGVAVVMLGASGFVYLKNMITANAPRVDIASLQNDYTTVCTEIDRLQADIQAFCDRFDREQEPSLVVENVANALRDFARLQASVKKNDEDIAKRSATAISIKEKIDAFFVRFGRCDSTDYNVRLTKIKSDISEADRLENETKVLAQRLQEIPEIDKDVVLEEGADREALLTAEKLLLTEIDSVNSLIASREAESSRLLAETQALPEIEERLENLKAERDEAVERYNVITATLDLLQKSKQDLSLRYLDKVTAGFKKYSAILGISSEDSLIDTDLNVQLECEGSAREKGYFSCGVKDMIDIAMRLGLCDALFEDEETVLILDDPFVNLDDTRLNNAMSLLRSLSQNRQIVYLTCHSSRC